LNCRPTTVLLAGGDALMRDGLRTLLSGQAGFEVVTETGDGEAVQALVSRLLPRLVLLDLDLGPDAHGLDIVSAIKAGFGAAVKVLVLTGELQPGALRRRCWRTPTVMRTKARAAPN
jgi:DNA-binding NarL/FixJ family response regulator